MFIKLKTSPVQRHMVGTKARTREPLHWPIRSCHLPVTKALFQQKGVGRTKALETKTGNPKRNKYGCKGTGQAHMRPPFEPKNSNPS